MDEKQIEKIAQELSEKDLNDLAAGKPLSSKAKKVLKYVGIGVVSAAAAAGAGVGISALVGWKTGKGPFNYLNNSKSNSGGLSENFGDTFSGNGSGALDEDKDNGSGALGGDKDNGSGALGGDDKWYYVDGHIITDDDGAMYPHY